jgi:hypothetical protein
MLWRLREHLGTAGLIVAIVALSVALAGGAIAANGGAGNGKATASAKAKKGPRGPKGPKGDTGPAGPAGPAGPQGAKGDNGAAGANGSNGADGAKGATGNQGTQGTKGATGVTGPTGQTGYTKTLPPGETETGTWGFTKALEPEIVIAPISFTIPLPGDLGADAVHLIAPTGEEIVFNETTFESEEVSPTADCAGTAEAPSAVPGALCVYATATPIVGPTYMGSNLITNPASECALLGCTIEFGGPGGGAGTAGALIQISRDSVASGWGTWAVSAPLP